MFKSIDGASSWAEMNYGLTDLAVHSLAIDPVAPETIYAGTTSSGVFVYTFAWTVFLPVILRAPSEQQ